MGGYGQFEIKMGDCDWWREGGAATEGFVDRNLKETNTQKTFRLLCLMMKLMKMIKAIQIVWYVYWIV